jgi:hypothetical protein
MGPSTRNDESGKPERNHARVAGQLFLWTILLGLIGGFILSQVAGSGTFAETAARLAASERPYRVALTTMVMASLSSTLLALALYATLRPVNRLLAQVALVFSLEDSFLALIVRMCGFVKLHFYLSVHAMGVESIFGQALVDLMRTVEGTTENLGGICFGIGSALFYILFFNSRYIPRLLSALGIGAAVIWAALYLAKLVFPQQSAVFQYICFPPMVLADVATGFYLLGKLCTGDH